MCSLHDSSVYPAAGLHLSTPEFPESFHAWIVPGKNVRTKRRIRVIDASYKKARVKLAKGQKIELFEEKTKKKK